MEFSNIKLIPPVGTEAKIIIDEPEGINPVCIVKYSDNACTRTVIKDGTPHIELIGVYAEFVKVDEDGYNVFQLKFK